MDCPYDNMLRLDDTQPDPWNPYSHWFPRMWRARDRFSLSDEQGRMMVVLNERRNQRIQRKEQMKRRLAASMGMHARLGAESIVYSLPDEITTLIVLEACTLSEN